MVQRVVTFSGGTIIDLIEQLQRAIELEEQELHYRGELFYQSKDQRIIDQINRKKRKKKLVDFVWIREGKILGSKKQSYKVGATNSVGKDL